MKLPHDLAFIRGSALILLFSVAGWSNAYQPTMAFVENHSSIGASTANPGDGAGYVFDGSSAGAWNVDVVNCEM